MNKYIEGKPELSGDELVRAAWLEILKRAVEKRNKAMRFLYWTVKEMN